MLTGEYTHNLDAKKRVSVPSKFRKELGKQVVITRGLDNCLFVYPVKAWNSVAEKLRQLPMGQSDTRSFNRFLSSGAVDTEIDSLGRVLIPDFLKDFAGLESRIVLIGVGDRVEIWNEERWAAYKQRIETNADTLAEKLGEVGII